MLLTSAVCKQADARPVVDTAFMTDRYTRIGLLAAAVESLSHPCAAAAAAAASHISRHRVHITPVATKTPRALKLMTHWSKLFVEISTRLLSN